MRFRGRFHVVLWEPYTCIVQCIVGHQVHELFANEATTVYKNARQNYPYTKNVTPADCGQSTRVAIKTLPCATSWLYNYVSRLL